MTVGLTQVHVPWITTDATGICFKASARDKKNSNILFFQENMLSLASMEASFGCPDIVISDYEPTVAMLAYSRNIPLITIDQQSKYLGYHFSPIDKSGQEAEASRLRLFFPQATLRIASSFFPLEEFPRTDIEVTVVPPILRDDIPNPTDFLSMPPPILLIYISPYGPTRQSLHEVVDAVLEVWNGHVVVYSQDCIEQEEGAVSLKIFNEKSFLFDLSRSMAVLCTAGHQLISEAVYLRKPILAWPFDNYEQYVNAHWIKKMGFGTWTKSLNKSIIADFQADLSKYRYNYQKTPRLYGKYTGVNAIIDKLKSMGLYGK
jgi:uncharacterized protein (TIGR00661 family)